MNYYTHARKLWRNYWRELHAETMRNAYGTTRHDTRAHAFTLADTELDTELDTAQVWELPTRRDTLTLAEWRDMRHDIDATHNTADDY